MLAGAALPIGTGVVAVPKAVGLRTQPRPLLSGKRRSGVSREAKPPPGPWSVPVLGSLPVLWALVARRTGPLLALLDTYVLAQLPSHSSFWPPKIMSLTVKVSLVSGKTVSLKTNPNDSVESLQLRAQSALGVGGSVRLLNCAGGVLKGRDTVRKAGLQNEDLLTLYARRVEVCSTRVAFAAILEDSSVRTWGHPDFGGDCSAVQHQLTDVRQIQATYFAFAAIKGNGSVISWGCPDRGGDCSAVQHQLTDVQQVQAARHAFAAIKADGSVVTWGDPMAGGDSSAVQHELSHVRQIQATLLAFAAIKVDGSVVTWGQAASGGDSSAVQQQLTAVQGIGATRQAFAAIKADGSVTTWGDPLAGGDSCAVQRQLTDVQQIQANGGAFAVVKGDGSVTTWGDPLAGSDSSAVQHQLADVQQIQANGGAFAVVKGDGSVTTWGDPMMGGDSSAVQRQLTDVQQIQANCGAFAAVNGDGSVTTWGDPMMGGDSSAVQRQLTDVRQIQANGGAFAVIKGDGSVTTWGDPLAGSDSSAVQHQLTDVQQVQATDAAFAAVKADGSIVTWGEPIFGGVQADLYAQAGPFAASLGRQPGVAKVAEAALEEHVWPELDAGSPKAFPDDAMRLAMYSALTKAILGASAELEEAELKRLMAATREYSEMRVKGKFGKSQDGSQLPPGAADIRAVVEAAMARAGRKDDIGLPLLVAASVGGAEIFPTLMHWILLYLAHSEALLKEMYRALRSTAYSVALGPPRKVLADSSVDGLEIPEGALLFALHPALVDRALEREPGPEEDFSQYAFGVGPRSCLGRPLAEAILPAVLGAILKRYEIAVPPEHKGEYKEALQGKMMGQLIRPSSSPRLAWLRP
eukprot:s280_g5.t1